MRVQFYVFSLDILILEFFWQVSVVSLYVNLEVVFLALGNTGLVGEGRASLVYPFSPLIGSASLSTRWGWSAWGESQSQPR